MDKPLFAGKSPIQIGMIVGDVVKARARWAAALDMEEPGLVGGGDYAVTKTEYMGKPAPDANCTMAFFNLGNIQLELIQPNEYPSTWRDFLEKTGGGIHHYGYDVEDIFASMEEMKKAGYKLTQFGYYGNAGGAYAYYDMTEELGCFVELLCSFKK